MCIKGRAVHSGALVLALAKIQDIFKNIPDIIMGLFLGMESSGSDVKFYSPGAQV